MQDICFILLPDISNALGYTQSSSKNHNATTHQTHFIELETPTKFTQLYKNGTEYKDEKFFGKNIFVINLFQRSWLDVFYKMRVVAATFLYQLKKRLAIKVKIPV